MLIVKVKICGLTNYEDAAAAIDHGADMLGFNFYPGSPRYINPRDAAGIIKKLPASVDIVGVFVNLPIEQIREISDDCELNWIQLHGDETPEMCDSFDSLNLKTIKALRIRNEADICRIGDYYTDAILLDAYHPDKYGGTGATFDWNIIGNIEKRVFLAGGINPDNAAKAAGLGVYGIDVCSGVEAEPGKKDHEKMKDLFENIEHLRV